MRIPIATARGASALAGCNANQAINPLDPGGPLRERPRLQSPHGIQLRAEQRRDRRGRWQVARWTSPATMPPGAAHLKTTQGLGSLDIPSAYHSNWLDNARAKLDLNGARAPISPNSSTPPGPTSAPSMIPGRLRTQCGEANANRIHSYHLRMSLRSSYSSSICICSINIVTVTVPILFLTAILYLDLKERPSRNHSYSVGHRSPFPIKLHRCSGYCSSLVFARSAFLGP